MASRANDLAAFPLFVQITGIAKWICIYH